jgi:DNA polymerase III delta prime subunit
MARIVIRDMLKVGKTDLMEVNCGVVESAIEMVRDINQQKSAHPLTGDKRAWLLDEMQSFGRDKKPQEALLKVLEECPDHVHFFLCTTETERLLPTLRGRCKAVAVKPVGSQDLLPLLKRVAKAEKITPAPEDRLYDAIADRANGSVRDALGMLQNAAGIDDPDVRYDTLTLYSESKGAFDLAKLLMPFKGDPDWRAVQDLLGKLKEEEPETCRRVVLATARTRLLNPKTDAKEGARYYKVISCLDQPLFDKASGHPLLAAACFRILFGSK